MKPGCSEERHQLQTAAEKLLALSRKEGVDTAEVCASFSRKTKIKLEKQDFHLASSDDGYLLGLRVLKDQRQGFSFCNTVELRDLEATASRAAALAKLSPPNPHYCMRGPQETKRDSVADLWDEALSETPLHKQEEWAQNLLTEATRDPRFRLNEATVALSSRILTVVNTLGTHCIDEEASVSWNLMGMAVDGTQITSFDFFAETSHAAENLQAKIGESTQRFCGKVLSCLQRGPAKSYRGWVVLSPRAVSDIVLSPLLFHFDGRNTMEKRTRWGGEDLGGQILSPELTLKDSPQLRDRMGRAAFDREGTPTRELRIIDRGKLSSFMLDHYSANGLNLHSTGHAVGEPFMIPTVGPHTICLGGGSRAREAMLRELSLHQPEFLLVNRFSGQIDPITGDFSGVAKGGDWWHGGERLYSVKETLISGNLFEILGVESSLYVSRETELIDSSEEAPTLIVSPVSVTAGGR